MVSQSARPVNQPPSIFNVDDIKKRPVRVAEFLSYYMIRREDIPEVSERDKKTYIAKFEA